jgi:hypothetical protein
MRGTLILERTELWIKPLSVYITNIYFDKKCSYQLTVGLLYGVGFQQLIPLFHPLRVNTIHICIYWIHEHMTYFTHTSLFQNTYPTLGVLKQNLCYILQITRFLNWIHESVLQFTTYSAIIRIKF